MYNSSDLSNWDLFLILWFPHSGCRWLNRSLLTFNSNLKLGEYFSPWLTHSTDMILSLDRTGQVHKTRSQSELATEFELVKKSVDYGRKQGIIKYFQEKKRIMVQNFPDKKHGGVLSPGAPEPLIPDLPLLFEILPKIRIIHLTRHPYDCFLSMKSRGEMDGNVYKIAASWISINASIREYCSSINNKARYILVRYEDLVKETENELKKLCAWIGTEFQTSMLSQVQEYHGRNKKNNIYNFSNEDEYKIFMSLVQSEAKRYSYTIDNKIHNEK